MYDILQGWKKARMSADYMGHGCLRHPQDYAVEPVTVPPPNGLLVPSKPRNWYHGAYHRV